MPNTTMIEKELADYLNKYSIDARTNTPDFILANHLLAYIENVRNLIFAKSTWENGQPTRFVVGDRVVKKSGYEYPGVVVSVFETTEENIRYVVEHRISTGMLHIFSGDQLQHEDVHGVVIPKGKPIPTVKQPAESTPSDDAVRHGTQPHSNLENSSPRTTLQDLYDVIERSGLTERAKLELGNKIANYYYLAEENAKKAAMEKQASDSASAAPIQKHYDFNTGPVLAGVDNTD